MNFRRKDAKDAKKNFFDIKTFALFASLRQEIL